MKKFTPIAMKCNQEQFKAIEPKLNGLKISGIEDFETFDYLVNNYDGNRRIVISNVLNSEAVKNNTHETWNEQIFLNACGIETDTYTVSKEFILEAHQSACQTWKTKIENEFKDLFVKDELEVGKWYTPLNDYEGIAFLNVQRPNEKSNIGYGISYKKVWCENYNISGSIKGHRLATPQEVETALINEAKRRGFKEGNYKCLLLPDATHKGCNNFEYCEKENILGLTKGYARNVIFENGKWATIIPQKTKLTISEIEAKLGYEIEIVK